VGIVRNTFFALRLCAAASVITCSAETPGAGALSNAQGPGQAGGAAADTTGSVGIHLTVVGGQHISQVSYTLGNGANRLGGTYDIGGATNLSFVIGSVPAGIGYGLTMTATTDDGTATCSFPAPGDPPLYDIAVVNRTTTLVSVNLQCLTNQGLDSGTVLIQGVTSNCAVWNAIVANPVDVMLDGGANVDDSGVAGSVGFFGGGTNIPAMVLAGQEVVMVGSATAPDPGSLVFTWTTNGGALSSLNGSTDPNDGGITTNQNVFTCPPTGAGSYTVALLVADGPPPDGGDCDPKFTTGTVTVDCGSAPCDLEAGCDDDGGCDDGGCDSSPNP
jgi:hypothetical protein